MTVGHQRPMAGDEPVSWRWGFSEKAPSPRPSPGGRGSSKGGWGREITGGRAGGRAQIPCRARINPVPRTVRIFSDRFFRIWLAEHRREIDFQIRQDTDGDAIFGRIALGAAICPIRPPAKNQDGLLGRVHDPVFADPGSFVEKKLGELAT